jgi:hypothetical protein
MKKPEMIIVSFVHSHIHVSNDGRCNVQFAGVSDKPSKLMQLQTWFLPFSSMKEAMKVRDEYLKKLVKKGDTFLIILQPKK